MSSLNRQNWVASVKARRQPVSSLNCQNWVASVLESTVDASLPHKLSRKTL